MVSHIQALLSKCAAIGGALFMISVLSAAAHAQGFASTSAKYEQICQTADRTQVDCACVGKRMATFLHVSPTQAFSGFTEAAYKEQMGVRSDVQTTAKAAMGSNQQIMDLIAAYNPHGGHQIEYEEGCVIEGASSTPIAPLPAGDVYASEYKQCSNSTGSNRFCQCHVGAKAKILTKREHEAHFLSFTEYSGATGSHEELRLVRAQKMSVAPETYDRLLDQATTKLNEFADSDGSTYFANRCHAITYGEDHATGLINSSLARSTLERAGPPIGLESIDVSRPAATAQTGTEMLAEIEQQQQDAFDDGIRKSADVEDEARALQNSAEIAQIKDGSSLPSAADVIATGCAGEDGRSPAYCQCLASEFDQTVPASMSEGGKRMAAMMLVGSGLPPAQGAQISNNTKRSEQMEATQVFADLMDLPERCEASAKTASVDATMASAGTVRERYLAMCSLQFEEMSDSVCTCAADYYEKTLNKNEWSMMIDIQVAELKGEDDAFEQFAENAGLSQQEAQSAIMSNPRLMQAMMGIGPACLSSGFGLN